MSFTYTPATMAAFDQKATLPSAQWSLQELMEAAGLAVAQEAMAHSHFLGGERGFLLLAGRGNNGGDAFVAARHLHQMGAWVLGVVITAPEERHSPLAQMNLQRLPQAIPRLSIREAILLLKSCGLRGAPAVIDGLMGTGFHGDALPQELLPLTAAVIDAHASVVAIDCPSGLECNQGVAATGTIPARLTVALCAVKEAMLNPQAAPWCGTILLRELPGNEALKDYPPCREIFADKDAAEILPRGGFSDHKYQRGALAIVGGSPEYIGAPYLAGSSALFAGAGMVTVLLPQEAPQHPQPHLALIVRRYNQFQPQLLANANAFVVGPGMGRANAPQSILEQTLALKKPTVVDADGLFILAQAPQLCGDLPQECVLTPHQGEFRRLQLSLGLPAEGTPQEQAVALARRTGAVVVMKGPHSTIASPNGKWLQNLSGTPALATAGSGDVLAGVIGAMLAKGLPAYEAAALGAFLHGRAAELVAGPGSNSGLIADQLPPAIAQAIRNLG